MYQARFRVRVLGHNDPGGASSVTAEERLDFRVLNAHPERSVWKDWTGLSKGFISPPCVAALARGDDVIRESRRRSSGMTQAQPTIVIEARPESVRARLWSLWHYRAFFGFLAKEIVMRRARGTLLGFWWVLFRALAPAVTMIYTFTAVKPVETSAGVPYSVFFLSGFITWRVFQSALSYLPRTMTWTQSIMRRAYFPRLLVPLAGLAPR